MDAFDLNSPCRVHFIGIGGISMSGIAELLLSRGFSVSGSDSAESPLTNLLREKGAGIYIGQRAENIEDGIDLVVYTAAIRKDNPELAACVEKGIPMLTRAEVLGQIMKAYSCPIAVSGTHGKTTTTSMLSEMLLACDSDPTLSIGGILKDIQGNFRIGSSDIFVTEACEYTNSFLSFFPKYALILNIEEDHLDFFKDLADIRSSFQRFASLLPSDGGLIVNYAIPGLDDFKAPLACPVYTFGLEEAADYHPSDISYDEFARCTYTLHRKGKENLSVTLGVPGKHNVLNSMAALMMADLLNLPMDKCLEALTSFSGTDRRFEKKGERDGVTIIDDYAHHPTEISACLAAAKKYPHKKLYCIFQPHTYTRTKAFLDDFAKALLEADTVILADIYAAREKDTLGISSETLLKKIEALGGNAVYFPSFEEIEQYVIKNCQEGDLLITMGAGDVVKIGEELLSK